MIYPDPATVAAVGVDPQTAEIPELHKAVFRWLEKFVNTSWDATADDLAQLRAHGASDSDIAEWLNMASLQIYLVSIADAAGVPLERELEGSDSALSEFSSLHRDRSYYHDREPDAPQQRADRKTEEADLSERSNEGWLSAACSGDSYQTAVAAANSRYGLTPNLFAALSACPDFYPRHQLALDLLEKPHSTSLSPAMHALARAATVALDQCDYFVPTVNFQLQHRADANIQYADLLPDPRAIARNDQEQVVLAFAEKLVRYPYKITEQDAQGFRDVGLDDAAYVDAFNTVSLQRSLDLLANCLGVTADQQALLSNDFPVHTG
jgi:alkylhydroperoxidase family enzyme